MKELQTIEDNKVLQTTLFNYSIYVAPTLDCTPLPSNDTTHQSAKKTGSKLRSSSNSEQKEHSIDSQL